MNTKKRYVLILALALLTGAALVAGTWAAPGNASLAGGGSPTVVAYQGEVRVEGNPHNGTGYFKFAVVNADGDTSYWSNDGTSADGGEPAAGVPLVVSDGLFSVLLGDTTLGGMTQPLTADVFGEPDRFLRVWFSSDNSAFDPLTPDTRIAAVPYALQAERVRGYAGVVVVAHSGGDFTSVQAAIDSITDATDVNPYLVWVAPGVYTEQVTMKPYVHLQGAGKEVTGIASDASSSAWPPDQATLALASDTSLRDLAVGNYSTVDNGVALLASPGIERVLVADVKAVARGSGTNNMAIFLTGSGTEVTLQEITAVAGDGSNANFGLINASGAAATLRGGSFTALGGDYASGIFNADSPTTMEAVDVTALGEDGNNQNQGLVNNSGAWVRLHGGSFTGRGGIDAWGIVNSDPGTWMEAADVIALGEEGSGGFNHGLDNFNTATVVLHGGSFTGRGGVNAYGIHNDGGTSLVAGGITALGEGGSDVNYGLDSSNGTEAKLDGGFFTGSGGTHAYGISTGGTSTILTAESVNALAHGASIQNAGLRNYDGAGAAFLHSGTFFGYTGDMALGIFNDAATLGAVGVSALGEAGTESYGLAIEGSAEVTLNGGEFIGRGGTYTYGIRSTDSGTSLEAESVTVLGKDGTEINYGLVNLGGAAATLRGGSFTGRGGHGTHGIFNGAELEAESVVVVSEDGEGINIGLRNVAKATLRGGSFTGQGGMDNYGIYNGGSDAKLEAGGVTALADEGSTNNRGLYNYDAAEARLWSSSFTGRGGTDTYGIHNYNGATLEGESVSALGEGGSGINRGLYNENGTEATLRGGSFTGRGGTSSYGLSTTATANVTQSVLEGVTNSVFCPTGSVTVSNSRLVGGAVSGTVTCVGVSRLGTFNATGCP